MPKLTQEAVKQKADRWAKLTKQIKTAENSRNDALHPHQVKYEKATKPIIDEWDEVIDPLQEKADELETEILGWLGEQKKSIRLEGKLAVAELAKGTGLGNRIVDAEKFVAKCVERKIKDFWKYVKVTIKDASLVMGKEDMDDMTDQPKVPFSNSSLTLKD